MSQPNSSTNSSATVGPPAERSGFVATRDSGGTRPAASVLRPGEGRTYAGGLQQGLTMGDTGPLEDRVRVIVAMADRARPDEAALARSTTVNELVALRDRTRVCQPVKTTRLATRGARSS